MFRVDENDPVGEIESDFPWRDVQIRRGEDVKTYYDLEEEIGRGKFGTVYKCREKGSKLTLAAKFVGIAKRQDRKNVEREVEIMRTLQHPRLIQLYDAFESDNTMIVILELITGGELFERVIDDDFILTEKSCTVFMRQICEGVAFIHANFIIHLDLKPENILCLTKTGNRIKIIDFGLARKYEPDKKLQVLFGTPEFVAPEVVNFDQISCATDMWSVGVICYVLLSGLSPFMGESDIETMSNVTLGKYDFEDDAFEQISADAKDFISKLLVQKKELRLSAAECLEHPWIHRKLPPPPPYLETTKENLKNYVLSPKHSQNIIEIMNSKPRLSAIEIIKESDKKFLELSADRVLFDQKDEKFLENESSNLPVPLLLTPIVEKTVTHFKMIPDEINKTEIPLIQMKSIPVQNTKPVSENLKETKLKNSFQENENQTNFQNATNENLMNQIPTTGSTLIKNFSKDLIENNFTPPSVPPVLPEPTEEYKRLRIDKIGEKKSFDINNQNQAPKFFPKIQGITLGQTSEPANGFMSFSSHLKKEESFENETGIKTKTSEDKLVFKQLKSIPPWFSESYNPINETERIDRRSSDVPYILHEENNPSWSNEIKKISTRLAEMAHDNRFDSQEGASFSWILSNKSRNNQTRKRNKFSIFNRDVPLGFSPQFIEREFCLSKPGFESNNTQSAPESPRLSPELKISKNLKKMFKYTEEKEEKTTTEAVTKISTFLKTTTKS